MTNRRSNRLIILLFLMFFYILAQLGWWAYLISRLTRVVHADHPRLEQRILMVWGEGLVFALLLLAGFIFTYRSYLKELRLARIQRNFLLSVTHEFKTPIASIRLQLETLLLRKVDEEKQKQLLERAIRDIDRLNGLTGNILTASRIEQNEFPVFRSTADLSAFLVASIEHLQTTVGKDHTTLVNVSPAVIFSFDADAMNSIVGNLYENAVKYSPKGSTIRIALEKRNERIRLTVEDEGNGIPEKEKQKVFARFFRSGDENTRSAKGTGLGLYITRHFVLSHNGKIFIENRQPNGSRFVVEFDSKA
ncbi:MAG: sensor histidine kinase [Flavobacteriales bacterium]